MGPGHTTSLVALGLMLAAFLPPFVWRLHVQTSDTIITPLWERRVLALAILGPLIPAAALLVAAARRTLRLPVVIPLVAMMVLGVVGGAALMSVLKRDFIFEDKFLHTEKLEPEELHLYNDSFFTCTLKVYAAPSGAVYGRLVYSGGAACADIAEQRARWATDGGVEIYRGSSD